VDKELQPFVDDFIIQAKIQGKEISLKNIVIKLGNANDYQPQENKIGYCLYQRDSGTVSMFEDVEESNIVIIDQTFFNRASVSDVTRRELVFHELGHCILNRAHNETLVNNAPISIMYPSSVSMRNMSYYMANESKFLEELFNVSLDNLIISEENQGKREPILFISTEDGCIKTK
jgi:hypothetical protein